MHLKVKRLTETAKLTVKGTKYSAGYDIFTDEEILVRRGETVAISTGISMAIPEGYYGRLVSRSSVASRTPIRILEGIIDSDYRGEVKIMCEIKDYMYFDGDGSQESGAWHIEKGAKLAQLIIQPLPTIDLIEVDELDDTERGVGGFGSTGN